MYIKLYPDDNGNHGNPVPNQLEGTVWLPDELLSDYIDTKGFATLTIENEEVNAVAVNQEALDAYEASLPDPASQPEPMSQSEIEEMLLDQEYRILLLEYGLEDEEEY